MAHSLPLVLIAAVSPLLFLNASRVIEAAGISAGLWFAGGAVLCLVALGIPTMGLMGAATSQVVAAELASRGIDGMLTNFTTLPLYLSVAQRIGNRLRPG